MIRNLADIDAFRPVKNIVIKVAKEIKPTRNIVLKESGDTKIIETPRLVIPTIEKSASTAEVIVNGKVINTVASESSKVNYELINNQNKVVSGSIKLFHHISKIFERQLLSNAHTYHTDREILKRIKQQKVVLGQNQDD